MYGDLSRIYSEWSDFFGPEEWTMLFASQGNDLKMLNCHILTIFHFPVLKSQQWTYLDNSDLWSYKSLVQ